MKKLASLFGLLVVLSTLAIATDSDITPAAVTMDHNDVTVVQYCVTGVTDGSLDIVVGKVCRDLNSVTGCQAADDLATTELVVTPDTPMTVSGGNGCVDVELKTVDADGLYYYTINGEYQGEVITAETGSVFVPEFTVLGAGAALAIAGAYIAKKRKN